MIAASAADRAAIIFISLWGDIPRLQKQTRPPQFVRFCLLYEQCGRTALDHLKSTGELADWHDSKIRMITVVNYERYQSNGSLNGSLSAGNRQTTGRQAAGDRQQYKNNKNIKNIKEDKKAAAPQEVFPPGIIPLHKFSLNHSRACAKIGARW